MYPRMFRRWIKMGRVARKIEEVAMMKSCLDMMAVQQTWSLWRESAASLRQRRLTLGAALSRMINAKVSAAWNSWQGATEQYWRQQILARRVALKMLNSKLSAALLTWREA